MPVEIVCLPILTLHGPLGLLSHLLSLCLLLPAGSRHLVGGHEGAGLRNRHQVVGRDHAGVGRSDEAARHSLGTDGVLSGKVLLAFLRRERLEP